MEKKFKYIVIGAIPFIIFWLYYDARVGIPTLGIVGFGVCAYQKLRFKRKPFKSVYFFMALCSGIYIGIFSIKKEDRFNEVLIQGNIIVNAIEQHKETKGFYPEDIDVLMPEYLEEFPEMTCSQPGGGFHYQRDENKGSYALFGRCGHIVYKYPSEDKV